ncbi:MAG TPA: carboxylating nicotinate-nucleotide diphosphorylase [Bacteriovoracaceae bacterium]|nr:carboxylating nicotinate-nucleotide diphosphorylase [Bacteriovoracaceae bacterium]
MKDLLHLSLLPSIQHWLEEDDLTRNVHYTKSLPEFPVMMTLNVKSDVILAGTDYFIATLGALGANTDEFNFLKEFEGKSVKTGEVISFTRSIPFQVVLTGERLALNLLQHASSIATWTAAHVKLANKHGIKILDTRKTTPGLRSLEKYAVRIGGGHNHRFGQADVWMIKDNHKNCMGGLKGAYEFFKSQGTFYNEIVAEIHKISELEEAITLGIQHVMLDNFSPADVIEAIKLKRPGMTFEVSGGIRLNTIRDYLIKGVDALSIGALTYSAPRVDLSLKFKPI